MMRPLNRRIGRNIYKNIKSYISIIIISLIAVLFYTGLEANYHYLENRTNKEIEASNVADNYITINKYDSQDNVNLKYDYIYDSNYNKIKNTKSYEIDSIEKRFYCDAYYDEREIFLVACASNNKMNVPAEITKGDYNEIDGVLVSEAFAKRRKLKIGSTIKLSIKASLSDYYYDEEIANMLASSVKFGKEDIYTASEFSISFKITGFMKHAEAVGVRASNPGLIYMSNQCLKTYLLDTFLSNYDLTLETESKLRLFTLSLDLYNQYLIKGGNLSQIRKYFSSKVSNNMLLATPKSQLPTLSILLIDVENTKTFSYVFPIIFYVCAVLIVIATIMKEIDNEEQNIGLMNALGIKKSTIALHYSSSTITSVLAGGIVGFIIGPIFIPWMMNLKYKSLYSLVETKSILYYPSYLIIFLVLILCAVLTSVLRVYYYLRLSPKDCMNKNNVSRHHIITFKFLPFKWFNLKMALRNIFWSPFKSVLVLIGVLGCSALLICSMGIEDTTDYGINLELNERLNYDIDMSYNSKMDRSVLNGRFKEISYYEDYQYSVIMAFNSEKLIDTTITVIDSNSKCINIPLESGGCTITTKMAKSLDIKLNDNISIYLKNDVYEIPVTNIVDLFMSQTIYISKEDYSKYDEVKCNRALINCDNKDDVNQLQKNLKNTRGVIFAKTKAQRRKTANSYLETLTLVTNIIKAFAIILAIAVIYDLASLNYKERIRDIAQLKVLGYGYKTNMKTLVYETGILSAFGCIMGLFIGKPLMALMLSLNENDMISFIPHIYFRTYLIAFILTVGISNILNILLSIRINKLDMVKSIKGAE